MLRITFPFRFVCFCLPFQPSFFGQRGTYTTVNRETQPCAYKETPGERGKVLWTGVAQLSDRPRRASTLLLLLSLLLLLPSLRRAGVCLPQDLCTPIEALQRYGCACCMHYVGRTYRTTCSSAHRNQPPPPPPPLLSAYRRPVDSWPRLRCLISAKIAASSQHPGPVPLPVSLFYHFFSLLSWHFYLVQY